MHVVVVLFSKFQNFVSFSVCGHLEEMEKRNTPEMDVIPARSHLLLLLSGGTLPKRRYLLIQTLLDTTGSIELM